MTAASNQIIPNGSYNNVGVDFITPYTAAQAIVVATSKTAATGYIAFDGANTQLKVDKIAEYTAANGIRLANDVKWTGSNWTLTSTQADAADTGYSAICGGGANGNGRGAKFLAYGADHGTLPGIAFVVGDDGPVRLQTTSSTATVYDIDFQPGQNTMWSITGSNGDLTQNATNGGHINIQRAGKGLYVPQSAAVTAAGTNQGTATALTRLIAHVTSGTGGVSMLAASAGFWPVFISNVAGVTINVFPASGDAFLDQAVDAAITLANRTSLICWSITNDIWGYVKSA